MASVCSSSGTATPELLADDTDLALERLFIIDAKPDLPSATQLFKTGLGDDGIDAVTAYLMIVAYLLHQRYYLKPKEEG